MTEHIAHSGAWGIALIVIVIVIAQSFLARTFGAYTLQLFAIDDSSVLVPVLGVGLLLVAFLINLSVTGLIQGVASALGFIKIGGIVLFGVVAVHGALGSLRKTESKSYQ